MVNHLEAVVLLDISIKIDIGIRSQRVWDRGLIFLILTWTMPPVRHHTFVPLWEPWKTNGNFQGCLLGLCSVRTNSFRV